MPIRKFLYYFTAAYLIILFFFGVFYEEMTDVFINVMSRGIFTSEPIAIFNNYGAHFLLNHLYTKLNSFSPLGWYGIINLLFQYLSLANTVFLIYRILKPDKIKINWLLFSFLLTLMTDDILNLQYTKTAIYLICSSILNILFYEIRREKIQKGILYFNLALFITGLLIRPQAFYLSMLLLIPLIIFKIKIFLKGTTLRMSPILIPLALITLTILFSYTRNYTETDKLYSSFSQFSSSVWDGKQPESTLALKDKKDSTIYQSFQLYFIPEIRFMNDSFFNSIGIYKQHYATEFIKVAVMQISYKVNLAKISITRLYNESSPKFLFLIFLILYILYNSALQKQIFRKIIIHFLWTIFILSAITIIAKMEFRVFYPIFFFSIICALMINPNFIIKKHIINLFFTGLVFISGIILLQYNSYIYINRIITQREIKDFYTEVSKSRKKMIFVADMWSLNILFGNNVLKSSLYMDQTEWLTFDCGYHIFFSEYEEKRKLLTNANTFQESLNNVKAYKNKYVFIFTEARINLLKKYAKDIYNIDINFKKQKEKPLFEHFGYNGEMHIYQYSIDNED